MSSSAQTAPADGTMLTEVVLPGVVEPDGLQIAHRPIPDPTGSQALVRIEATGISFAEQSMRRGRYPAQPRFPFVPGYDIVGTVTAVGEKADRALIGRRVAAVTKIGGWSSHLVLDSRVLVPVPAGLDPADAETVLLNGVTAVQMLCRKARVSSGQTILVHGANGGVANILVQLARRDGVRVIGTAAPRHHAALRELGVEPIDYHDPDLVSTVRALAPGGVDAVFDHLGGPSFARSFSLLAPGGTLVGYGTATQRDDTDNQILTFAALFARFAFWTVRPDGGRRATFYNFWGGSRLRPAAFRRHLATDLTRLFTLVGDAALTVRIGARVPLVEAGRGLALSESGTVSGKVILIP